MWCFSDFCPLVAVEDTAASQRAVPKKLTGQAAKLLTWEEQGDDITAAAATPRVKSSASAPARKRQRTAEPPQGSASAPSRRAQRTPTLHAEAKEDDDAGAVSASEGGAAVSGAKRRRAGVAGKQGALMFGPPQPAALTTACAEELPSRRFRSISAIYKAADAEDGGPTAARAVRASSTAAKRPRATPRSSRTPQQSAPTAEAQRTPDAADTVVRDPQPGTADQPTWKTPGGRTTRAAAGRPHGSQLAIAEAGFASALPQAKLPAGTAAAVAVGTSSHDGAARTDDGPAAVTSAARGLRRRAGEPSAQPPAADAQDVSADGDASSGEGQHGQPQRKRVAPGKHKKTEAAHEADTAADGSEAEHLGGSIGHSDDEEDASVSHATAEDGREGDAADDTADDSDAFLQTLAARMLATAADGQASDDDEDSGADDGSEPGQEGLAEHDGSAGELGFDLDDELGERRVMWAMPALMRTMTAARHAAVLVLWTRFLIVQRANPSLASDRRSHCVAGSGAPAGMMNGLVACR